MKNNSAPCPGKSEEDLVSLGGSASEGKKLIPEAPNRRPTMIANANNYLWTLSSLWYIDPRAYKKTKPFPMTYINICQPTICNVCDSQLHDLLQNISNRLFADCQRKWMR